MDEFLNAARKDLGYREKGDGYTKYGDWYYANVDKSDPYFKNAPWCDMFITWAVTQAGVQDYVGEFAYTVDHAKWFKKLAAWSDKPEAGAIVFYDWSGSGGIEGIDHAGIVEKVQGTKIFTIEANVDEVWLKRKERDQGKVVGYGLPRKVQEALAPQRGRETPDEPEPGALGRPDVAQASVAQKKIATVASPDAGPPVEMLAPAGILAVLICAAVLLRRGARTAVTSDVLGERSASGRRRKPAGRHRAVLI
ncbi:CHAP domain-containing protein [Nonomuraea endophytica]|uniref:CHAP domain-containing protein n=1 Tax=Nonomuraea endophytica TaxID=714136 RepID=UPI0037C56863